MRIEKIDQVNNFYKEYIIQSRIEAIENYELQVNKDSIEPLSFATYFGLFLNHGIAGFLELYFYDEAFGGYKNNLYSNYYDLSKICPSPQMVHVRTAFIDKKYRTKSPYFVYLYLLVTKYFYEEKGARFATMGTIAKNEYLNNLYIKMGAKKLCYLEKLPGFEAIGLNLFVIDLEKLLKHPLMKKVCVAKTDKALVNVFSEDCRD